jgi:hypothetical protein
MRFFASLWERVPVREAVPTLMPVMVGAGAFGFISHFLSSILSFSWD